MGSASTASNSAVSSCPAWGRFRDSRPCRSNETAPIASLRQAVGRPVVEMRRTLHTYFAARMPLTCDFKYRGCAKYACRVQSALHLDREKA